MVLVVKLLTFWVPRNIKYGQFRTSISDYNTNKYLNIRFCSKPYNYFYECDMHLKRITEQTFILFKIFVFKKFHTKFPFWRHTREILVDNFPPVFTIFQQFPSFSYHIYNFLTISYYFHYFSQISIISQSFSSTTEIFLKNLKNSNGKI